MLCVFGRGALSRDWECCSLVRNYVVLCVENIIRVHQRIFIFRRVSLSLAVFLRFVMWAPQQPPLDLQTWRRFLRDTNGVAIVFVYLSSMFLSETFHWALRNVDLNFISWRNWTKIKQRVVTGQNYWTNTSMVWSSPRICGHFENVWALIDFHYVDFFFGWLVRWLVGSLVDWLVHSFV